MVGKDDGELAVGIGAQHVAGQEILIDVDDTPVRHVDEADFLADLACDDRAGDRRSARHGIGHCRQPKTGHGKHHRHPDATDVTGITPHESNPIWSQLSAVKNNRVFYVGDQWVETNGPIAREIVLREAAHYLYPDTFPAIDVKAEAAKLIPAELQN